MSKDPYKIVDSKPTWLSKLGSAAVALGSVATAIVVTVPGLPGYQFLGQDEATFNGQNSQSGTQASDPGTSADAGLPGATTDFSSQFGVGTQVANSLGGNNLTTQLRGILDSAPTSAGQSGAALGLPGVNSGNTSSPTPWASSQAGASASTGGSAAAGNTSSPTPTSSGQASANNPSGSNTSSGNTSSPTPVGSESEYDEDEDEDEDEDDD